MKLESLAKFVEESIEETLSYMAFPTEHWRKIRTNNGLERIMKEIRRRTRVVGSFPDGYSAMMLVGARLRHISTTKWGMRQYLACKTYETDVLQETGTIFIINQKEMCAKYRTLPYLECSFPVVLHEMIVASGVLRLKKLHHHMRVH